MNRRLPDFSGLRILVVGDVMIDRYLSGRVSRISPEAPVPVVRLLTEENRLGGAANVVLNLKSLGAAPLLLSVVGNDENGRLFRKIMAEHQLETKGLVDSNDRQTTVKTRVLADHQQLLRADREDTHALKQSEFDRLHKVFEKIIDEEKIDLIILQDYNKGVLSPDFIEAVCLQREQSNIPLAVDPKKTNFWAYRGVDLFKPNLREIQEQLDFEIKPELDSLDRATKMIRSKLGNRLTMITLAAHGVYIHNGERSAIYPTQARKILDVSGAGDSVISIAGCCLAKGMEFSEIALLANLAGGQVIEKPGVVAIDLEQLRAEYEFE